MTVETISKNKIKISLTDDEILTFFGGYDLIDYKYPAAKKMLNLLLKEALPDEMLPLDCKRVLIEVKPQLGGCAIFFTKIYENTPKRLRKINQTRDFALIFKSGDDLMDFAKNADKSAINHNSLYIYDKYYALLINAEKVFSERLAHIKEYCSVTDNKTEISKISEYGIIICEGDALMRIEGALKGP